ncbi:uncharacterized protein LOC117285889 isoform X1 [Fukomys damarensis]|uniref:uncharacterized protein LOC117285889 isoform X1 n=1 Tax=Fukomys damarensis TaxID=885580 RepID=UPI001455954F|nr:uncharacterized protein LOC117285889 isoform X1 [Fukomys damarensis]
MRGRRASTEVLWPGAEGAPRGCAHPCAVGGLPQGGCLSALTEEEPETQAFCSLAKVTQGLVRTEVGSRIPAQPGGLWVLTAPAGKQVWSWGSSQSSQIPTGSLVICPPPPHPSARQVAGAQIYIWRKRSLKPVSDSHLPGPCLQCPGVPSPEVKWPDPHQGLPLRRCLPAWGGVHPQGRVVAVLALDARQPQERAEGTARRWSHPRRAVSISNRALPSSQKHKPLCHQNTVHEPHRGVG